MIQISITNNIMNRILFIVIILKVLGKVEFSIDILIIL